jgi:hypothetical protein
VAVRNSVVLANAIIVIIIWVALIMIISVLVMLMPIFLGDSR